MDGYIARTFEGQSSSLGSVLDPLADKCLISVLCITLTMASLLPGKSDPKLSENMLINEVIKIYSISNGDCGYILSIFKRILK